jgi:hypothetical protein
MPSKIILKKSSVASKVPVAGDLDFGELAINYSDSKLYFKKADGSIGSFTSAATAVNSVAGYTGDVTATNLLDAIKTVDGTGSGLDADTLDGLSSASFYLASNPNGYTTNTGTVTSVGATSPVVSSGGNSPTISMPAATASAAGHMTIAYAAKLDGIAAGAQVNVATNLAQGTRTTTTVPVTSSTGTAATLDSATTSLAGVMSSADKTKLDGIASGATANTGTVTSVGGTGSYGGLTLSGTVTTSGNLTLGGTPTGTWPISVSGNAATATSADQIDGIGFRNTGSNSAVNADTLDSNGITYYTGGVPNFSGNATDGALYSQAYSASWQHQIAADYRSGQIALRGKNNGTWQAWRTVLDSTNYTVYAPTKTGTGASGTWGISITGSSASTTGNAATAAALQTARTIGGVSFNGTANINLPGVNTDGNQNTSGGAARISIPDTRAVNDQPQNKIGNSITADFKNNTAVSNPPVTSSGTYSHIMTVAGWDTAGGSGGWPSQLSFGDGIAIRQATSATAWGTWRTLLHSNNFNSYSPSLTGTGASGTWGINITGNAATATKLQTARTINGVSFDGTANINIATKLTILSRAATSVEVAIANALLSIVNRAGSTINVAVS